MPAEEATGVIGEEPPLLTLWCLPGVESGGNVEGEGTEAEGAERGDSSASGVWEDTLVEEGAVEHGSGGVAEGSGP